MNRIISSVGSAARRLVQSHKDLRCFYSSQDRILTDVDSQTGICKMRLNAPPVNVMDGDMLDGAVKAIKTAEAAAEVRGIILTSNFDGKVFSAGLDITNLYQKSHDCVADYWTLVQELYLSWYGCSKPIVVVINGHALAGGCAWTLMCDYRIMQSGAGKTIGLTETKLGISVPSYLSELFIFLTNHRPGELSLLQGMIFDSNQALKIGLVDDVDSLQNLMGKAEAQLKSFMEVPQQAFYLTKFMLRQKNINELIATRKEDAKRFADQLCHPAVQERIGLYLASLKERKKK